MNRRDFLFGISSFAGLTAAHSLVGARRAFAAAPPARAKACILLWMNGGPSHIDTWDPKPGTAAGGKFKAIPTRVDGLSLSEHLPQVADVAQHLAILRGMTSKEGNHDRAQHLVHTGWAPNPTVAYPSLGSWVAHEVGDPNSDLPLFVSINGPSVSAGFLGVQYNPFIVQNVKQPLQNTDYAAGVNMVRFLKRKQALESLEDDFAARTGDPKIKSRRAVYARAIRMMYAPRLKAFDLGDEPDATTRAYGDSDFGRGCLMARRLVEGGVRFVEVVLDGWDTHKDNFGRTQKLMGALDPAFATLVRELDERKLLSIDAGDVHGRVRPHAQDQRRRRARSSPGGVERGARGRRRARRRHRRRHQRRRRQGRGAPNDGARAHGHGGDAARRRSAKRIRHPARPPHHHHRQRQAHPRDPRRRVITSRMG